MPSLARRIASRVRSGLSRRVSPVLERVGLREPRAVPAPATGAASAVDASHEADLPSEELTSEDDSALLDDADRAPTDTVGAPILDRAAVERLFEDMVRPALQSDGGDITLVSVEGNDVFVELTGACHTCPSSVVTMQDGIERLLREEFPHFGRLVRVDG